MEDKIWKALKKIIDPELGVNIVDLGLIYKVKEKEGLVSIIMTLTSPMCPFAYTFESQIKQVVLRVKGINKVNVRITFAPLWSPKKVKDELRLGLFGC